MTDGKAAARVHFTSHERGDRVARQGENASGFYAARGKRRAWRETLEPRFADARRDSSSSSPGGGFVTLRFYECNGARVPLCANGRSDRLAIGPFSVSEAWKRHSPSIGESERERSLRGSIDGLIAVCCSERQSSPCPVTIGHSCDRKFTRAVSRVHLSFNSMNTSVSRRDVKTWESRDALGECARKRERERERERERTLSFEYRRYSRCAHISLRGSFGIPGFE